MNSISIEGTTYSPKVICDAEKGIIEFLGRSIPENANEFYTPILNWLTDFNNSNHSNLSLTFALDYINSVSYKMIFEMMLLVVKIKDSGKQVDILWKYEEDDDEILEEGRSFANKLNLDFTFEEVPEQ